MKGYERPLYLVEYGPTRYDIAFTSGLYDRLFKARAALAGVTYAGHPAACVRIVRIGADHEKNRIVYSNF